MVFVLEARFDPVNPVFTLIGKARVVGYGPGSSGGHGVAELERAVRTSVRIDSLRGLRLISLYADPASLTCGVSTGCDYVGFSVRWRRFNSGSTLTDRPGLAECSVS